MKCVALLIQLQIDLEGVIYMSYKNGKEVLPDNILSEIQKYYSGGLIYIPLPDEKRCEWGTKTTTKNDLAIRNKEICSKKDMGTSIYELMEEYSLSYDTIKRIVYKR